MTVVYGDTEVRARLASTVLEMMGFDAPVYRGCEQPLSAKVVMWPGHEGVAVPGLSDARYQPGDAVDVSIELASIDPGSFDIVAIGPLTNIATAIDRDPAFVTNVRRLVVMGGSRVCAPACLAIGGTEDRSSTVEVVTDVAASRAHEAILRSLGCVWLGRLALLTLVVTWQP